MNTPTAQITEELANDEFNGLPSDYDDLGEWGQQESWEDSRDEY